VLSVRKTAPVACYWIKQYKMTVDGICAMPSGAVWQKVSSDPEAFFNDE